MELTEYQAAFEKSYKEDPARVAYQRYLGKDSLSGDDPDLLEAWKLTLPLTRIVFLYEFHNRTGYEFDFSWEDLESFASVSLWKVLCRKKVPCIEARYTTWCFKEIKYRFLDVVRENRRGCVPRDHIADRGMWHSPSSVHSERQVELQDFARQIPRLTRIFVLQRIGDRFHSDLEHRAAEYVVRCLGTKEKPNLRLIQNYYKILNPEFWVDLVTVLLREALYLIRRKFGHLLYGSSSEFIYDYVEGLW